MRGKEWNAYQENLVYADHPFAGDSWNRRRDLRSRILLRAEVIPGVEVNQIALDGLTYEDARDELRRHLVLPSSITLAWKDQRFSVPLHSGVS